MEAIVLGLGGMGSAAAYHLARRGWSVRGFEQHHLVHDRGSSHGHTRIIRTAYYEHPGYIPLVRRAFELWHDLEQATGKHLLTKCDCLTLGPSGGELIRGIDRAAKDLPPGAVTVPTSTPFRTPRGYEARLEHEAGFLYVEDCVRAHLDAAREWGARFHVHETVREWAIEGTGVRVTTDLGTYTADKLIITAGAWATQLLKSIPLRVMRQTLLWFHPEDPLLFCRDRFPIFLIETPQGDYYGLPMIDGRGLKVARHYGAAELNGPDEIDWNVYDGDVEPVRDFLNTYLCPMEYHSGQVCMYTLSPDRHFIIDEYQKVLVAAGFSGHGFKFAPAVGEMLADMAEGKPGMDMFAINRFV